MSHTAYRLRALLLAGAFGVAVGVAQADGPAPVGEASPGVTTTQPPAARPPRARDLTVRRPTATPRSANTSAPAAEVSRSGLDLRAPPVERVLPRADLQAMLADQAQPPPDDVRVEGPRYGTPVPVGFFRAVPWAVMHPTQMWRLFTPVTQP